MPTKTKLRLAQISGSLADNQANAFAFENEGGTINYLKFVTSDDSEAVVIGNTGKTITMNGNVDGDALETNLASSAASNKLATASAIKTYVDNVSAGLDVKDSVLVATTAPLIGIDDSSYAITEGGQISFSNQRVNGSDNIDGIDLTAGAEGTGSRILVKNQSNTAKSQLTLELGNGSNLTTIPANGETITITAKNDGSEGGTATLKIAFQTASATDTNFQAHGDASGTVTLKIKIDDNNFNEINEIADRIRSALVALVGTQQNGVRLGLYTIGAVQGSNNDKRTILIESNTAGDASQNLTFVESADSNTVMAGVLQDGRDLRYQNGIYYYKTQGTNGKSSAIVTLGDGTSDATLPPAKDSFKFTTADGNKTIKVEFDTAQKAELLIEIGNGSNQSTIPANGETITFQAQNGPSGAQNSATLQIRFQNSGGSDTQFQANGSDVRLDIDITADDDIQKIADRIRSAFQDIIGNQRNNIQLSNYTVDPVAGTGNAKREIRLRASANGTDQTFATSGGSNGVSADSNNCIDLSDLDGVAAGGSATAGTFSEDTSPDADVKLIVFTDHANTNDMNEVVGAIVTALNALRGSAVNGVSLSNYDVVTQSGDVGTRTFTLASTATNDANKNFSNFVEVDTSNLILGELIAGAAPANAVLERVKDGDADPELAPGNFFFVEQGDTHADAGFVMTADAKFDFTANKSNHQSSVVEFAQFSGAGAITAGEGIAKAGATLSLDINGLSNSGTDLATGDLFAYYDADAARVEKISAQTFLTAIAGTGLSRSSATLAVDASQAITALTGGDLTIFDDQNNADVSLSMGTGVAEALVVEVLNGGANKTAESVKFTSKTASGTANHGKFTFSPDEADVLHIDDGGIDFESGMAISHGGTDTLTATALGSNVVSSALTSLGTLVGLTLDGDKNITPGDGSMIHLDTSELTDNQTGASGTATKFASVAFEAPTLSATNTGVTTSDAATVYINAAPIAGTNQTLTRGYALWADAGKVRFDGGIMAGTTDIINSSGEILVAAQPNITSVGTLSSIELGADDTTLTRNAAGELAVEGAIVASRTVKHIHVVTGSGLPANTPYHANMGDISGMMNHHGTQRTKTAGELDVYVNGQLLVGADGAGDNFDYYPPSGGPSDNTCIAFEFALDAGDVIQLHLRDGSV